jgi:glycosyltransferase involved in cell wall biosynthesis
MKSILLVGRANLGLMGSALLLACASYDCLAQKNASSMSLRKDRFHLSAHDAVTTLRRSVVRTVHMVTTRVHGTVDRLSLIAVDLAARLGATLTARRIARGEPASLWGITPILTLPLKARCDRLLGFRSNSLVYTTYVITSAFDINLSLLARVVHRLAPRYVLVLHRLVLAWALVRYDIFHFFADRGIMPAAGRFGIDSWEMDVIRRAGKYLYVYCYGADVRTRGKTMALGRWNFCSDCPEPGKYCICDDATGEAVMNAIANRATALVSLGDMLTYTPGGEHLAYWPIDIDMVQNVVGIVGSGPLRVAHAPNHTHFKGTRYLRQAVAHLRARGFGIELITISGVSNTAVLQIFSEVDLVADQFIGGAYGYTALEAMACGKPVLTYVRDASLVEAAEECPFLITQPETIEAVLEWCLTHRECLPAIGAQGRMYVERWHSLPAVAGRFARLYLETAAFPEILRRRLQRFLANEALRRGSGSKSEHWHHPWRLGGAVRPLD